MVVLAVAAFFALAVLGLPFPAVILAAGLTGWTIGRLWPEILSPPVKDAAKDGPAPLISDEALHHTRPSWRRAAVILGIGLPLWLGPIAVAFALTGADSIYTQQGLFFSGTALVTFGGPTQCWPTSPSRPWKPTAGWPPEKWSGAWP